MKTLTYIEFSFLDHDTITYPVSFTPVDDRTIIALDGPCSLFVLLDTNSNSRGWSRYSWDWIEYAEHSHKRVKGYMFVWEVVAMTKTMNMF